MSTEPIPVGEGSILNAVLKYEAPGESEEDLPRTTMEPGNQIHLQLLVSWIGKRQVYWALNQTALPWE